MEERRDPERKGVLDRLFPARYDFYGMLREQANQTVRGVESFLEWLERGDLSDPSDLRREEQNADDLRHIMEDRLMEAFTTPFDRQDIYQLARQVDYILNHCLSTAVEMRAYGVAPNEPIMHMANALMEGVREVAKAVHTMERDHFVAESMINDMRRWEREIESTYVGAMVELFRGDDPIKILKCREIYYRLRDAGRTLSITLDILHRITVGIP
ncbi:MAG TPA: DUF47 family protein [Methanomassiliicoccaceae archaeon]|nr:DUF47 family protein [Methanomassiliicoccaceae archaeon]